MSLESWDLLFEEGDSLAVFRGTFRQCNRWAIFSLVICLAQIEINLLLKSRTRGCRLVGSDAVAPSRAWVANFIGDWLVLGVGAGVVRSIVIVPALGSVLTLFCGLVVSLVTIGFIVVGYTHTKHALKTSEASLQCYLVTN